MAKKLDVERIEQARQKSEKTNHREEEKERLREAIRKNRAGERKVTKIMPKPMQLPLEERPKTRVAAYCRVSTAEEAQAGSFEMQCQHFQYVIDNNPMYEMVKIYSDEGVSGTSVHKRLGFQEMMNDAKEGKIDLILTKSISRFGRNIVDILTSLRELSSLPKPVAVTFESEGITTTDGKNDLLISILSALAQLESQQKSIAIKEGIRYRMQEGVYKFAVHNTLGYYRDYSGKLKVDKEEAELVQYIYDCFLEGASPKAIADELTRKGVASPRRLNEWKAQTIRGILSNEKYCGDVLYQKTYSRDYLTHKSVKNIDALPQWHWENDHTAIIKREKWNMAQELLQKKAWRSNKRPIVDAQKKFVVARVKTGVLRGYFLVDMSWRKEEREKFLSLLTSVNELEDNQPLLEKREVKQNGKI